MRTGLTNLAIALGAIALAFALASALGRHLRHRRRTTTRRWP